MVVVVSPRWEYWLEVVTVRVTLHEVRQMAATIAQNSKLNAVRVIKCFFIFVLVFRLNPAGGAESLISVTSGLPPAGCTTFSFSQCKFTKKIPLCQDFTYFISAKYLFFCILFSLKLFFRFFIKLTEYVAVKTTLPALSATTPLHLQIMPCRRILEQSRCLFAHFREQEFTFKFVLAVRSCSFRRCVAHKGFATRGAEINMVRFAEFTAKCPVGFW